MLHARFDKSFGTFHLDVELTAESGSTVVLLGESGSGKTMVLKMLAGLMTPDAGRFSLDGVTYLDTKRQIAIPAQERPAGYVFQDYVLFPHLSVFGNVAFGLRMQKLPKKVIKGRVAKALEQVHLVGYDERKPAQLSGGQQQRVAIARALALEPQLLLLDESLSALDIQTRRDVTQELRQLLNELPVTTVMVSHDYGDALLFGDQIVVIDNGSVIQTGSHSKLVRRPASPYIAEMAGVNYFRGRVVDEVPPHDWRVVLGDGPTPIELTATYARGRSPHAAPARDQDVSVVIHPRSVAVQSTEPETPHDNVLRGEVLTIVPVSTSYTEGGAELEGTLRVSLSVDPALPPLRADIVVDLSSQLDIAEGQTVYAVFSTSSTRAFF